MKTQKIRTEAAEPEVDEAAIDALIAWSLNPDNFPSGPATRVREEAWGYSDERARSVGGD